MRIIKLTRNYTNPLSGKIIPEGTRMTVTGEKAAEMLAAGDAVIINHLREMQLIEMFEKINNTDEEEE